MKSPEGMHFTKVATTPTEVVYEVTAESVIHRCPVGSGLMPCCERTPFEVPRWHRLTEDEGLVSSATTNTACGTTPRAAGSIASVSNRTRITRRHPMGYRRRRDQRVLPF